MGDRNPLRNIILQILLAVQYDEERYLPDQSELAVDISEVGQIDDEKSIAVVNQKALTDLLEGKGFSQSEISKVLNKWYKEDGYLRKKSGRPNKWWLDPEGEIELGNEYDIDVEADEHKNELIDEVLGAGYPDEVSLEEKRRILAEAQEILEREYWDSMEDVSSLSVPEVDEWWGRLVTSLRVGSSNDPREWRRYALTEAIQTREIESDKPYEEYKHVLSISRAIEIVKNR